eukprot:GHVU01126933.1.p1 GENE.GHVU01126933.1~~GHVU01126933.1.p1  ORF type:complete len:320 (+),score=47.51 GHVU01126933.1:159-1118(+)
MATEPERPPSSMPSLQSDSGDGSRRPGHTRLLGEEEEDEEGEEQQETASRAEQDGRKSDYRVNMDTCALIAYCSQLTHDLASVTQQLSAAELEKRRPQVDDERAHEGATRQFFHRVRKLSIKISFAVCACGGFKLSSAASPTPVPSTHECVRASVATDFSISISIIIIIIIMCERVRRRRVELPSRARVCASPLVLAELAPIVERMAGPCERRRAAELLERRWPPPAAAEGPRGAAAPTAAKLEEEEETIIQLRRRVEALQTTKRLSARKRDILLYGVDAAAPTLTSDAGFVRACQQQGVDVVAMGIVRVHAPRSLTGL